MTEKRLGKIDSAEFGFYPDRDFLMGVQLGFSLNGCFISDGGKYTVNISEHCRWETSEREHVVCKTLGDDIAKLLKDAKVNYVSELVGKPVEVVIENNMFKDFRILTECL